MTSARLPPDVIVVISWGKTVRNKKRRGKHAT